MKVKTTHLDKITARKPVVGRDHWWLGAAVICLLVMASELAWLLLDTRLQPVVDEWVEKSLNLADGLANGPLSEAWRHLYWASLGPRFPLYPLLSVPALWFWDRSADALLLVNCASLAVLAWATYQLASKIFDARAGFLATALVLMYPATTSLIKLARPHALLPATCALAILALYLLAFRPPAAKRIWVAAGAILLVFASHAGGLPAIYTAVLLAAFLFIRQLSRAAAAAGSSPIRNVLISPLLWRAGLPAAILLLSVMGGWMFLKWGQYRGLVEMAEKIFGPMYSEWHYESSLAHALGFPSFVLFILALLVMVIFLRKEKASGALFVVLAAAGAFAFSHFQPGGKSWQSMSAVLPMLAVLTAGGLVTFVDRVSAAFSKDGRKTNLPPFLFGLVLIPAVFTYATLNWGSSFGQDLSAITGVRSPCGQLHDNGACMHPPLGGDWHVQKILDIMVSDHRCQAAPCDIAVLGHRQDYFSDEALTYSMVQYYPYKSRLPVDQFYPARKLRFERVKGTESDGWSQISRAAYVVVLLHDKLGDDAPRNDYFPSEPTVADELSQRIAQPSSGVAEVFRSKLPTGETLVLLSRA